VNDERSEAGSARSGVDPLLSGRRPSGSGQAQAASAGEGADPGTGSGAVVVTRRRDGRELGLSKGEWVDDWAGDGWEDDYWEELPYEERLRAPGGRLKWVLLSVLALVLVAAAVAGAVAMWVLRQINPPGDPGEPVVVAIDQGATIADIANQLEERGIITSASVFRWYLEWKDVDGFRAGYYSVRPEDSMGNIVKALQAAPEDTYFRVTFPEGFDLQRMARRLEEKVPDLTAERFLQAATSGEVRSPYQPEGVTTLEGMLFPDTYQVAGREDEVAVLQRMVRQMENVAEAEGIAQSGERVGLDPYQTLIVASLIEREARFPDDRPKIARVIYNRLEQGMPLQIDASVVYALGGSVPNGLTQEMIETTESPYNTYKIPGLPPTPIASPGRASIQAALNPAENPPEGPWLYYVVINAETGEHAFAQTYEQHLANIREAERTGQR